jgi:two-component system response regulator HydG
VTRVLAVDDDAALLDLFVEELPRHGVAVEPARSGEEALRRLAAAPYDVVVSDIHMRGMTGVELARRVAAERPDVPVLLLTAFGDLETAIAAVRAGAYDYLAKPIDVEALALAVKRAAERRRLTLEVDRLRSQLASARPVSELVAESDSMAPVLDLVRRVAPTEATVLVRGESGTGKELVARALHRLGPHPDGPFIAVNCAAIPEALLESELFGHVKGAFTGADRPRRGIFLEASGGTLFLDEVGDLPASLQPKLLRALQTRTVRALGGAGEEAFDARVVAATNKDLHALVASKAFREDLYYRLAVIEIELPPLRARGNDVLLLAQRFVGAVAARSGKPVRRLSVAAAERLLAYRWPGNVRELENAIERAVTLAHGEEVVPADLPRAVREATPASGAGPALGVPDAIAPGDDLSTLPTLAEVEDRYLRRVLEAVGDNKTLAAKVLGIDRKTLYRKLGRGEGEAPSGRGGSDAAAGSAEA